MDKSRIIDFFSGKSVFLTGVTGLLGKAVAEKILRSCPGVENIYALVRTPKGQDVSSRMEKIKLSPLFDKIKAESRDSEQLLSKIVPIAGDMSLPHLGISPKDRELLCSQVSVVIHSAANVKFYEKLQRSVHTNVQGTKSILELAKQMTELQSLLYVSTAYSNSTRRHVEEIVYPTELDPEAVIQILKIMPEDVATMITDRILDGGACTYMWTKHVAENLVQNYYLKENLPLAIARVSMVTPAVSDWTPGLAGDVTGASRFFLGMGLGRIRSMHGCNSKQADFIPLDHLVNQILAISWNNAKPPESKGKSNPKPPVPVKMESVKSVNQVNDYSKKTMIPVYNCVTGADNPVTWRETMKYLNTGIQKHPFKNTTWYPNFVNMYTTSEIHHKVRLFLFHFLPLVVQETYVALLRPLLGHKKEERRRKFAPVQKFKKLVDEINSVRFITTNELTFAKDNVWNLFHKMNRTDQQLFDFDIRKVNWPDYMTFYIYGLKKYVLNEDVEDSKSKTKFKILWIVHRGLQFAATSLILVFGWNAFGCLQTFWKLETRDSTTNKQKQEAKQIHPYGNYVFNLIKLNRRK